MAKTLVKKEEKPIPVYFTKDNRLIESKSMMTLTGRKIMDASIMKVQEIRDDEKGLVISSEISGSELREIFGSSSGSLYDRVKELLNVNPIRKPGTKPSPSLLDWKIIICDEKKKMIQVSNIITDAKFENGNLQIIFNNQLRENLIGYQNNYTRLDRKIVFSFTSNYSYQLYQILKKTIDNRTFITKEKGPFELNMDLIDLKVQLGTIPATMDDVLYTAVTTDGIVTYDAIEDISDKDLLKTLREFTNFRRYAIDVAKKEINELSDIEMDYEPIRKGRGGRGTGFKFIIRYKDCVNIIEKESKEEPDLLDILDRMRKIVGDTFTLKEMKSIAETAGYDMQKIKTAYEAMDNVQGGVGNPTGFMIRAIKEGYKPSATSINRKNKFNNFAQQIIDFDEFEKMILDN